MQLPFVSRRQYEVMLEVIKLFTQVPGQDRYGYDIAREINVNAGYVQLALAQLEAAGFLESYTVPRPGLPGPPRRHYFVSPKMRYHTNLDAS
jgi:DNA-binding PadR family transcriptional regulator